MSAGEIAGASRGPADSLAAARAELLRLRLHERGLSSAPDVGTIRPRESGGPAPLSVNQEGIWFIHSLDPDKPTYNIPGVVRIAGRLDAEALEAALDRIVTRHESLRTVFTLSDEGTPLQVVTPPSPFHLPVVDLSGLPPEEREAEVVRRAREDAASPFDLSRGPLFTAHLLRLSSTEHALVLKVHHLVIDGWSWGILLRELRVLYRGFVRSEPVTLPALEIQYADYAAWQREWLTGDTYGELVSYWTRRLSGLRPLELPTDRPRPPVQSVEGRHEPLCIPGPVSERLRRFAQAEGHTLFVLLLAAFKVLLFELSKQEDIVVGATFANRDRRELEALVGYFVTLLPLRTRVTADLDVRQLLEAVSESTTGAISHQSLPLTRLVNELGLRRDPSRSPLFQVVFYLLTPDHNPAVFGFGLPGTEEAVEMEGVRLTPIETECGLSRFDLMFLLWDTPQDLRGTVEYRTDLFDRSTIAAAIEAFQVVLELIVRSPDATVGRVVTDLEEEVQRRRAENARASRRRMQESLVRMRGGS